MPRATQAGDETASSCDDSYDDSVEDCEQPWISWFCGLKGNEMFCEIEEDYIQDDFNLSGLSSSVPYYDYALDVILDVDRGQSVLSEQQQELVESAAEMLYGLIHARYILTQRGMTAMLEKYKQHHFGTSDVFRTSTVKIFCPNCKDIYFPRSKYQGNTDGAYFGTTFPHLFLMSYKHLQLPGLMNKYEPRIFGFKVHKTHE